MRIPSKKVAWTTVSRTQTFQCRDQLMPVMFKRDQIMFNPQDESDGEDDINGGQGEAVLGLDLPDRGGEDEDDQEEEEADWDEAAPKARKEKVKPDLTTKGRFGKDEDSDDFEEEEDDSAAETDEDDEGWGRQYYSKPSARRAKERDDVYDEKREEERELEEKEVRRLQRRAREAIGGAEDWGLDDVEVEFAVAKPDEEEESNEAVLAPKTTDPDTLLRHMQFHEPLKLALARDFPLVVRNLKKTARGIEKMEAEAAGEETLHKGLGWLHYQTLLTYATTLAFYIHLCALPEAERPDLSSHPIIGRLLQLKEGLEALENLDFAAGSVTDPGFELYVRPGMGEMDSEDEEEMEAMMAAKRELMGRMLAEGEEGSDESDDEDMEGLEFNEEDAQNLWNADSFEDDELQDLLADQESEVQRLAKAEGKKNKRVRSRPNKKAAAAVEEESPAVAFTPIAEPTFVSSSSKKKSKKAAPVTDEDDTLGDMLELDEADAGDKERQKKSLRFHTSRIAAMSARRSAARERKLGGDDDVPYRDRQAARDAALRKNAPKGNFNGGAELDGSDWTDSDRKRAREVRDEADGDVEEAHDDDGYYDLVKRQKVAKEEAKAAAHEEFMEDKLWVPEAGLTLTSSASFEDETAEGPRAINRAIEKNRGLTPRRSKTGRNPRVKKRQKYEEAKRKVGSQRAVYKGGQSALSGAYSGEKSGISTVVKSRKF